MTISFSKIRWLVLLFSIVQNNAYTKEYCDYTVKETESLDKIIKNYLTKSNNQKKVDSIIYNKTGMLKEIQSINSLTSVNLLKINQVIKIPCDWIKPLLISKETAIRKLLLKPEKIKNYDLKLTSIIGSQFKKSEDTLNGSNGDIFIFPSIDNIISYTRKLNTRFKYGFSGGLNISSIDQPNATRTLSKSTAYYVTNLGAYIYDNSSLYKHQISLKRNKSIFLKATSAVSSDVETYSYTTLAYKITTHLLGIHLVNKIGYHSSILASDEFESGYFGELSLPLSLNFLFNLNMMPSYRYEYLQTSFEKQTIHQFGIGVQFKL